MLVSILIINYNNEQLLQRAIQSCLIQTYKNIEILVYDDKSTDNSLKKIKQFKKKINFFINKKKKKIFLLLMRLMHTIHYLINLEVQ